MCFAILVISAGDENAPSARPEGAKPKGIPL